LYLRIAPELYLKRLVIGGLEGVFELGKQFRNEGVDKTHVNEFTTLELYRENWDYVKLMEFTEELFQKAAAALPPGGTAVSIIGNAPFDRVEVIPAINRATGASLPEALDESHLPELQRLCLEHDCGAEGEIKGFGVARCIDKLLGKLVEPTLQKPTFLMDHPRIMSPLAKGHRSKGAGVAERFELFIGGLEYVNAYSELNDPDEQLAAFEYQVQEGDPESPKSVDYDYVEALQHGLPTCGGWGLGVDRFVMLLTETSVIDDVIFFPRETTGPLNIASDKQ
jgi:lysyl-tRNA synthetase class 2